MAPNGQDIAKATVPRPCLPPELLHTINKTRMSWYHGSCPAYTRACASTISCRNSSIISAARASSAAACVCTTDPASNSHLSSWTAARGVHGLSCDSDTDNSGGAPPQLGPSWQFIAAESTAGLLGFGLAAVHLSERHHRRRCAHMCLSVPGTNGKRTDGPSRYSARANALGARLNDV